MNVTLTKMLNVEGGEHTELCGCNILFKYGGVPSLTALKQSEAVLKLIPVRIVTLTVEGM